MAKGAYIGINNVARKVKKIYVGVDGVARKVKKAYIGIGGVARLWFSSGLAYHGTATSLSTARQGLAATSVGNYALFAGGDTNSGSTITISNKVSAYDKALTRTTPTTLSAARYQCAAATVGTNALVVGGYRSSNVVDSYNASLTRSTLTKLPTNMQDHAATSVGNYALFGGGYANYTGSDGSYNYSSSSNYAYNSSLTRSTFTLNNSRDASVATSVGNYALFAGGIGYKAVQYWDSEIQDYGYEVIRCYQNTVEAFNTSLTRVGQRSITARANMAATRVGNYALITGGTTENRNDDEYAGTFTKTVNTVNCFNSSLTAVSASNLSTARSYHAATTLENYAIFAGSSTTVDVYDSSLTKVTVDGISVSRSGLAATTIGSYALFAGGIASNTLYNTVDVYTV